MKNILLVLLPLLMATAWGCHSKDDEPTAQPEIYLLPMDSLALSYISANFNTESADYPHPWSMTDRSSWKGNIELDTIVDPDTNTPYLVVGALTLYITEPSDPMDGYLGLLKNVRDFKLYACPGATFRPGCIPYGCDSVLVDKIDYNVPGYINVVDRKWNTVRDLPAFDKIVAHWLDVNYFDARVYYTSIVDISNNQLDGNVDTQLRRFVIPVNLSHNKYTGLDGGWETWMSDNYELPNLQYNDIPIPEEILDTDFWRENHERFIGNPGYQAPK